MLIIMLITRNTSYKVQ